MSAVARPVTPLNYGGFTFAERPDLEAPDARIIWHADFDPGTLLATAHPAVDGDPDGINAELFDPWLTIVTSARGEHAVLSDGWHHIRIDIAAGSLAAGKRVVLHYHLRGMASAAPKILPLRRLLDLHRRRRFSRSLYPADSRIERWLATLRVRDAVAAGASHREIADVLFADGWSADSASRRSDSLRSRVKRLVREASALAAGGYRMLLRIEHRHRFGVAASPGDDHYGA